MKLAKGIIAFAIGMFIIVAISVGSSYLSSNVETTGKAESRNAPIISSEDKLPVKEPMIEPVSRKYEVEEFQAGMNLLVYGDPDLAEAEGYFERFRELGFNSVTITFPFYQEHWQANEVRTDPVITPELPDLERLIQAAQIQDLKVMLRPTMDEQSLLKTGHWRGEIQPTDPGAWFDSYFELLLMYADLAEKHNVEYFNIGTEFNSIENRYSEEWLTLIEDLRVRYKGDLLYSFNWNTVKNISSIEFVQQLDHVGIDAYYPLDAPDGASVDMLTQAWSKWTEDLSAQATHPSVLITEAGMIPIDGAYRRPYAWKIPGGTVDRHAQADYYEATFTALKPISEGIYWWSVTLDEDTGNDSLDYSPLNGPAEDVLRQLFVEEK
ncbi:glycoside hydrolase family 113 [Salimicrobium halophilum]|uniref:Cellulase (Glycosyl hydrolase family 5) n=1 Tax=Salimicrobium halophilum TaxID=86666 RepID=A0A1G8REI9_9BACI|nr:hypothetical protein [Salimicrobium halophilum]SDJ15329.1 hypothetical protein SAMN04490247_0982 [Salimicrobium halophilum]